MSVPPDSTDPHYAEHEYALPELTSDAKNWAVICHLSALLGVPLPLVGHVVGPLVVWMLKKDDHPFIDDQGKEAVNFQISMAIYMLVAGLMICIVIGIALLPILWVTNLVFVIIAAVAASRGEAYRYPMTIRLIN
jgi:uncharacterized protein